MTRQATKGKNMNALEVKKVGRSFCVVAGVSVIGKFRTEAAANNSLSEDWEMYSYWAGSCSVSVENTPAVVVKI